MTMLVRVDICATRDGVLVVNVSHQTGGFAPYRLDNCSSETLHLRSGPGLPNRAACSCTSPNVGEEDPHLVLLLQAFIVLVVEQHPHVTLASDVRNLLCCDHLLARGHKGFAGAQPQHLSQDIMCDVPNDPWLANEHVLKLACFWLAVHNEVAVGGAGSRIARSSRTCCGPTPAWTTPGTSPASRTASCSRSPATAGSAPSTSTRCAALCAGHLLPWPK